MKKTLSLLLCVLLLLGAWPLTAFASGSAVYIRNIDDWNALAENCVLDTWSAGREIVLSADLDFSGEIFTPVPLFAGHFDGRGHTVSGIALAGEASTVGLFRQVLRGAVVEDLTVTGDFTPEGTARNIGGIAGENHGTIRNCVFEGTVTGKRSVGGICGMNAAGGAVEDCEIFGTVEGEHRVGGVAGENEGTVAACHNHADVNTRAIAAGEPDTLDLTLSAEELIDITDVGGIAGISAGTVRGCVNDGDVGYLRIGYNIGGIVGHQSGLTEDCRNEGRVLGRKDVGGIVGQLDPDAGWNFSKSNLADLQARLSTLQQSVDLLLRDTEAGSAALSGGLTDVLDALSRTGNAAEALTEEGSGWINDNLETVNELSTRVSTALEDLAPAVRALAELTDQLSPVLQELESALSALGVTADLAGGGLDSAADAAESLRRSHNDLKQALEDIRTGLDMLGSSLGSAEDIRAALAARDLDALLALIDMEKISDGLALLRKSVEDAAAARADMERANTALIAALRAFGNTGDQLAYTLELTAKLADLLTGTAEKLSAAADAAAHMEEDLAALPPLTFAPLPEGSARESLFQSLGEANAALSRLAEQTGDRAVLSDLRSLSDQLFALTDELVGALSGAGDVTTVLEDISSGEETRSTASVAGCINLAAVEAETNVGGVVGAVTIDLSFDREDELDLSSLLSGGARYLIFASVRNCGNTADIFARKTAAGGIVGRMDCGAVADCVSGGGVSAAGDYAGGIAGYSAGTLLRCSARVNLSAGNYLGGIAGQAHDLRNCLAMPAFSETAEFQGAVAGYADGTVADNYYTECAVGGVDGFSFAGQAEAMAYEDFLRMADGSDLFRTVTVTFLKDGEPFAVVSVPYGGALEALPAVPDRDGQYWAWDTFNAETVYSSLTVEGCYLSPIPVLSTGEEPAFLLAEGTFYPGQSLTISPCEVDVAALGDGAEEVLTAGTVSVNDNDQPLTLRLREDREGQLFARSADGVWKKADFYRDGSYLVFSLENGGVFAYVRMWQSPVLWIVLAAAVVLVAALCVALLVRHRKKKRVQQTETTAV